MTILATVLLVTSVWVFLAAVLGGCGSKDGSAAGDADNVLAGEFWLWERREGGVRPRAEAGRPDRPALRSPTA